MTTTLERTRNEEECREKGYHSEEARSKLFAGERINNYLEKYLVPVQASACTPCVSPDDCKGVPTQDTTPYQGYSKPFASCNAIDVVSVSESARMRVYKSHR